MNHLFRIVLAFATSCVMPATFAAEPARAGFDALATDERSSAKCTGFRFDLTKELSLFSGSAKEVKASGEAQSAPLVQSGELYEIALAPQTRVRFLVPGKKATVAEGSFAGIFKITAPRSRTLRVTLDEAARVDVIQGNITIASTRHTGSHDCAIVRKSVEFEVNGNEPLLIQLSGSTVPVLSLAVTSL